MKSQNKPFRTRKSVGKKIGFFSFFRQLFSFSRQNITVMIVPHVEGRVFNLRVSVWVLIAGLTVLVSLVVGIFLLSTGYRGTQELLAQNTQQYEEAQSNLLLFRDKMEEVNKVMKDFKFSLDETVSKVGLPSAQGEEQPLNGDFSYFGDLTISEGNSLKELEALEQLRADLAQSISPLQGLGDVLNNQKELLADVPTLWPLKGGVGIKTLPFGPALEPFTKRWYIHRGLDLYHRVGTPIVSTANGVVVKTAYDPKGFGNYVIVRHKYGLSTLYAHMSTITVTKGQTVSRGDIVGTLGGTGYATGPHLHYEVRVGSQVVDPEVYLNISTSIMEMATGV